MNTLKDSFKKFWEGCKANGLASTTTAGLMSASDKEQLLAHTTGLPFDVSSASAILDDIMLCDNNKVILDIEVCNNDFGVGFDSLGNAKDGALGLNVLTLPEKNLSTGKHSINVFTASQVKGTLYIR